MVSSRIGFGIFSLLLSLQAACVLENQSDETFELENADGGDDTDKIVGGRAALPGEFPSVVGIVRNSNLKSTLCTGTLIEPDVVLTAAHCLFRPADSISVSLGTTDLKQPQKIVGVRAIEIHPDYVGGIPLSVQDIGLVFLKSKVYDIPTTQIHRPFIPLKAGLNVTLAGFGQSDPNSTQSGTLRTVDRATSSCQALGLPTANVGNDSKMFCIAPKAGTLDVSWSGDSGGPWFISAGGEQRVIGVVSGRYLIGGNVKAAFASRASLYLGWLDSTILEHRLDVLTAGDDVLANEL